MLKYRQLHGDMIEIFKILHHIYDPDVSLKLNYNPTSNIRGNKYQLLNCTFHYGIKILFLCVYSEHLE